MNYTLFLAFLELEDRKRLKYYIIEMENETARYVELGIFKVLEKHEVLVLLSIASGKVFYFFFIKQSNIQTCM